MSNNIIAKNYTINSPIGIYDSGIGGLTVLASLIKKFPNEKFIYFADTANLPYGNKTKEQIIEYSNNIISWFQNTIKAKLVIAACHTSSALALEDLEEINNKYTIPIIGTIYPLLNNLLANNYNNIGIIATPASANSRVHENIFKKYGVKSNFVSIGCPNFVPIIESIDFIGAVVTGQPGVAGLLNLEHHPELNAHAEIYLQPFIKPINLNNNLIKLDTLIFGCTHYPLIKNIIQKLLPAEIIYLDPAEYITQEVFEILNKANLINTGLINTGLINNNINFNPEFYCSSEPEIFTKKTKNILNINATAKLQLL